MPPTGQWVLLAYRLPREPSAPRLALWRKLKRLGVAQLLDGLVALPLDSRNRERLEWLADEVAEAGGEASIWTAAPATAAQERHLANAMRAAIAAQYRAVIAEARASTAEATGKHRRTLSRLRREPPVRSLLSSVPRMNFLRPERTRSLTSKMPSSRGRTSPCPIRVTTAESSERRP